jgi:HD-GYP domain-containing protein (c-di-GMP phosphodiesterase class II)
VTIYGSVVSILRKEFEAISQGNKIEVNKMLKIASILLGYVSNVKEEALLHIARGRDRDRMEVHATNVGILASLVAAHLQIKGRDLVNTVAGAMMHDIGILLLPDTQNAETLKEHTMYGFRYLKSIKNVDPLLVMPSLQHHEKANGDGYPNKIGLNNIELSSRITTICDSIDNQISFIKFGNDLSIHFTKNEFLNWKKDDFDQKIFLASITAITNIFKIESVVRLSNGFIAVIKKTNIRFPLNPVVQTVADKEGNKIKDQKIIDLIRTKDIWLSKFVKRV